MLRRKYILYKSNRDLDAATAINNNIHDKNNSDEVAAIDSKKMNKCEKNCIQIRKKVGRENIMIKVESEVQQIGSYVISNLQTISASIFSNK